MSGIVGSRLNHKGSGLVGSLGTDGQVFTSAGAGVSAVYEDAGGGAWNFIATQTASNSALIEFDTDEITSTYDVYKIFLTNIHPASDGVDMYIQFRQSASYITSGYRWSTCEIDDEGNADASGSQSASQMQSTRLQLGTPTGEASGWEFTLWHPLGTDNAKMMHWNAANFQGTNRQELGACTYNGNQAALDGLKFYMQSGNFTSGTFAIYGLSKS